MRSDYIRKQRIATARKMLLSENWTWTECQTYFLNQVTKKTAKEYMDELERQIKIVLAGKKK